MLGREPCKFEVYNNIDGELVKLFRTVCNRPAELLLELGLLPLNARTEFQRWLHFETGEDEVRKHLPAQLEIIDRLTSLKEQIAPFFVKSSCNITTIVLQWIH